MWYFVSFYSEPSTEWGDELDDTTRDNRDIVDNKEDNSQQLTMEEIENLKKDARDGSKIVHALVANSRTFDKKSELSQQKYKKMKSKKYVLVGCARRPSACALAKAYYSKQPSRIGFLRPDTLALALTMGNVGAHHKVLVIEGSSGLVTGAVAERLGGLGEICSAHFGKKCPGIGLMQWFGLPEHVRRIVHTKSLHDLLTERGALLPSTEESSKDQSKEGSNKPFTSCILTSQSYSAKSMFFSAMPLLAPSASFVVTCHHLDPLAETMNLLKRRGLAINMTLTEAWWRDFQVLPMRTHPLMNMNHGGWYLLSGTVTKAGTEIDLRDYRAASPDDAT